MKTVRHLLVLAFAAVTFFGCTDFVDEVDQGGVLLNLDFTNTTNRIGVNNIDNAGLFTLDTLTINSIVVRPGGPTSQLMDVQLNTVEVTYSRADTGTRVPPALVYNIVGNVPAGGQVAFNNVVILSVEQIERPPLSDLLFENGGVDKETGSELIKLDISIRVFGQTIGGEAVASQPRTQTYEIFPLVSNNN